MIRERKFALLIGSSRFEDDGLSDIKGPTNDISEIGATLSDPKICGFKSDAIRKLINPSVREIKTSIHWLFSERRPNDVLFLYYSGHGLQDMTDLDDLFVTGTDTEAELPAATAVSARWIKDMMDRSQSERKIIVYDCCFSGSAALIGMAAKKGSGSVLRERSFVTKGDGTYVLTSCSKSQQAWADDLSLYSRCFIETLRDGISGSLDPTLSIDTIHDHVQRLVVQRSSGTMRPTKFGGSSQPLIFARNTAIDATPEINPEAEQIPIPVHKPKRLRATIGGAVAIVVLAVILVQWLQLAPKPELALEPGKLRFSIDIADGYKAYAQVKDTKILVRNNEGNTVYEAPLTFEKSNHEISLPPANYFVTLENGKGFSISQCANFVPNCLTLQSGVVSITENADYYLGDILLEDVNLGRVHGIVFQDSNGNGEFESGLEYGIPNVRLSLLSVDSSKIGTIPTSGDGRFDFVDLSAGSYQIDYPKSTQGLVAQADGPIRVGPILPFNKSTAVEIPFDSLLKKNAIPAETRRDLKCEFVRLGLLESCDDHEWNTSERTALRAVQKQIGIGETGDIEDGVLIFQEIRALEAVQFSCTVTVTGAEISAFEAPDLTAKPWSGKLVSGSYQVLDVQPVDIVESSAEWLQLKIGPELVWIRSNSSGGIVVSGPGCSKN